MHLSDALHVPDLRTNLLSVAKITDKGFTVIFKKERAEVIDGEENVMLVANRIDDLYYIRARKPDECKKAEEAISNAKIKGLSLKEWHERFGHLNVQSLRETIRKRSIQGMRVNNANENFQCELSFQGKMSRSPFPKQSKRESNLGDLVHSDVCSSMRHTSIGGNRFFVTFIDDHSGWCEVKFISHKDRVLDEFEKYRALVETQSGRKVKCIQSDNGREYVNKLRRFPPKARDNTTPNCSIQPRAERRCGEAKSHSHGDREIPLDQLRTTVISLGRGSEHGQFHPKQMSHEQIARENLVRGTLRKTAGRKLL